MGGGCSEPCPSKILVKAHTGLWHLVVNALSLSPAPDGVVALAARVRTAKSAFAAITSCAAHTKPSRRCLHPRLRKLPLLTATGTVRLAIRTKVWVLLGLSNERGP